MTWTDRTLAALGITRAADATGALAAVAAPPRTPSLGDPRGLTAVHRALQVLTTAAAQLPLTVERGGRLLTGTTVPAFVRRPDPRMTRSTWVTAIALYVNA